MTKGIGIDIVEVERLAKRIEKPEFVNLVFTETEIDYCQSKKYKAQHFAARFAAKEAYMKSLGLGWTSDANFKEIEIINDENGAPRIELSGQTLAYFQKKKFTQVLVTLSHTESMATAMVVID